MSEPSLSSKVINATKWSTFTELAVKLISPITNMILARILAPEAFGVVATVTMIVSFMEMFTDAGFQKYLVQREFRDQDDRNESANVAFWTNFGISCLLWIVIFIFRDPLVALVGNPGLGYVLAIACLQLPITAFSSIQMALYRRNFDFKSLFLVKLISACVPFVITIPLAIIGFHYWSLIVGNLVEQLLKAAILTIKSNWKPSLTYRFIRLKEMFSFSAWTTVETFTIWLNSWIDAFIIGTVLSQYYLGLYRTSTVMVNAIMGLITTALFPVVFSALSRLQNEDSKFTQAYLKFQKYVSIFVLPLGIGIFLFSDLATKIILGSQWNEASAVIGNWALTTSITIVFGRFSSEVYRSKGRPKLSFFAQFLHLIVLVPTVVISSKFGFWPLVYARSWIRMQLVLVHMILMKYMIGIPILKIFMNVSLPAASAVAMGIVGFFLQKVSDHMLWDLVSIMICIIFYFGVLLLFPKMRRDLFGLLLKFYPLKKKSKTEVY